MNSSSFRSRTPEFPAEILVDPTKRDLFLHPNGSLFAPTGLAASLKEVDEAYIQAPDATFLAIENGVVPDLPGNQALGFYPSTSNPDSNELVVFMSPLNDGVPESKSETITSFVNRGGKADLTIAAPNSWRPASKLHVASRLSDTEGAGVHHMQVFAPEAPGMRSGQRFRVASGDMTVYGELALDAIKYVEDTTGLKFEKIHFFCAGMGAKALGAAALIAANGERQVGCVTLMNFSLGDQGMFTRLYDYATRKKVGEEGKLILPNDFVTVPEMKILKDLDKHGAESAMRRRQLHAMKNVWMLRAVMNAKKGLEYIEEILKAGATITVGNAINESLTTETERHLAGITELLRTRIVGIEGQKVGMLANEHGSLVASMALIGLLNHRSRATRQV